MGLKYLLCTVLFLTTVYLFEHKSQFLGYQCEPITLSLSFSLACPLNVR